jgi:hypothetical protein
MMDAGHLESGAIIAIVSSELLQIIKGARWFPWLTAETQTLNRIVSGLIAFAAGLGISTHYDPQTGVLTISGLLSSGVLHGFAQWAQAQVYYRLVVKKGS